MTASTQKSAYVHIPFCSHKCDFCDFAAFAGLDHLAAEYCQVVIDEIEKRLTEEAKQESARVGVHLTSVFYGGGTPGLVDPELLAAVHEKLLAHCRPAKVIEVTLETTPHAITVKKARQWLAAGINRISIGIETFIDNELQAIGRDHSREQAFAGVEQAIEGGFENISIDLMYALPTQSVESWKASLSEVFKLSKTHRQVNHFSAYGLHLASQSPLYSRFSKDSLEYPDDDTYTRMYETLVESAANAGFQQYEISNFSRNGHESQHNLGYWNGQEYYAFGVSAHRYVDGIRSSNWRSLQRYMKDPLGNETYEVIDAEKKISETIMLGLRKRAGLSLTQFEQEFGFSLASRYSSQIKKLVEGGFLELSGDHLVITQKGVPVSNSVIAELF